LPKPLTTPRIALTSNRTGTGAISLYDPATRSITRLSPADAYEQDPAISPDGRRIAFVRYEPEGRLHLMTMAVDGSDRKTVTNDPKFSDTGPHWSPDSQYLVFTRSDRTTGRRDVYTVGLLSPGLTVVTTDGASTALDWSPYSNRLLFVRRQPGQPGFDDVRTADPTGLNAASLSLPLSGYQVAGGDYSPDGKTLVLTYDRDIGSPLLSIANADGSNLHPIVSGTNLVDIGRPSWSPDGATIVFSGHQMNGNDDLYTLAADGKTEPQNLLTGAPVDVGPDWGPKR
jgi:dipeptidyl aminopeptidase/acylaminoacyl peptidase